MKLAGVQAHLIALTPEGGWCLTGKSLDLFEHWQYPHADAWDGDPMAG